MKITEENKPKNTNACPLRYKFYTKSLDGFKSHRATYCCHRRYGMFLGDMKCVGLGNEGCPIKDLYPIVITKRGQEALKRIKDKHKK